MSLPAYGAVATLQDMLTGMVRLTLMASTQP